MCNFFYYLIFSDKMVDLVGGGFVINGAYPDNLFCFVFFVIYFNLFNLFNLYLITITGTKLCRMSAPVKH